MLGGGLLTTIAIRLNCLHLRPLPTKSLGWCALDAKPGSFMRCQVLLSYHLGHENWYCSTIIWTFARHAMRKDLSDLHHISIDVMYVAVDHFSSSSTPSTWRIFICRRANFPSLTTHRVTIVVSLKRKCTTTSALCVWPFLIPCTVHTKINSGFRQRLRYRNWRQRCCVHWRRSHLYSLYCANSRARSVRLLPWMDSPFNHNTLETYR